MTNGTLLATSCQTESRTVHLCYMQPTGFYPALIRKVFGHECAWPLKAVRFTCWSVKTHKKMKSEVETKDFKRISRINTWLIHSKHQILNARSTSTIPNRMKLIKTSSGLCCKACQTGSEPKVKKLLCKYGALISRKYIHIYIYLCM